MKISYYTLGCKLNQAETDELKKDLAKHGFLTVPFDSGEDIAVIRACGVTGNASQKTREMIRRAKRMDAYIVVTGCSENKDLPEIDFLTSDNDSIVAHLTRHFQHRDLIYDHKANTTKEKTRALIKIQNGCNFRCAYCIIPTFRGRSQSVPADEVVTKVNQAVKNGYKEVVLSGVNICQYQDEKFDLAGLLNRILNKTSIARLRLGSLDPRLITDDLIKLYADKSIVQLSDYPLLPHWHLSLQSGSNSVLKRMARAYTAKQYEKIVNQLRQNYPLFSFTTDIIVGFPSETDEEFAKTCEFVQKIGFAKVHIFPFSPRPGTVAAKLKPLANHNIVNQRVKKLAKIAATAADDYQKKLISLTRPILFESKQDQYCEGYTPEYTRIRYKTKKDLKNQILQITLK